MIKNITTVIIPKIPFILAAFLILAPQLVQAEAALFIAPPNGIYKVGELFSALLNVNSGGKAINAVSAQVNFDNAKLKIESVGYSKSVLTIWTQEPVFSNAAGTLNFSGGLPNPGFTGASGAILRITFKSKAAGQAPVAFISGSVLANDGEGTNILDNLDGALYTIRGETTPIQKKTPEEQPETKPMSETAVKPVEVPVITEWPKQLESGQTLTIKGLGLPLNKILIAIQKGSDEPVRQETYSGADGRFSFTHSKPVGAGFYRIWARNVSADGLISATSDAVTVEVIQPTFFRIGTIALNYASVIVTLLSLLTLAGITIGWLGLRLRKWQIKRGVEVSEAEKAVHHGFDTLKESIRQYLNFRKEGGQRIKRKLEGIERKIEKEIKDIEK